MTNRKTLICTKHFSNSFAPSNPYELLLPQPYGLFATSNNRYHIEALTKWRAFNLCFTYLAVLSLYILIESESLTYFNRQSAVFWS